MDKKIDQLLFNALSKGDERKIREIYELYNSIMEKELPSFEEEVFFSCDEKNFMDDYFLYLILLALLFCFLQLLYNYLQVYDILKKILLIKYWCKN